MTSSAGVDLPEASRRLLASVPGLEADIHLFPEGTKTARDAADAIGCPVAAIVKSLVFVLEERGDIEPVVALIPGDMRLDLEKLAMTARADSCRRASLEEVRSSTGFAAGGTPPFGHATDLRVFADSSLRRNDPVWAAGGTPTTVFPITISDLDRLARPIWVEIT